MLHNILIVLGLFLAMATLNDYYAHQDEAIVAESKRIAEEKKAQFFAAVAACLNGKGLRVADHIVDCIPRKK